MRKFIGKLALLFAAALLPLHAMATYDCNVTVGVVLVYANGNVNVLHSGRGDYTVMCNLNADYKGVAPTTCATWTALLLSIKKKGGTAALWFEGTGSCATLPTYTNAPAPVYVGDITP